MPRIVLEALAVTLGRDARARAIQLPAWNEALGLPRPWDQQWSLRIQQILAFETDLLDYPDIFEGSKVMDGLVDELVEGANAEMKAVEEQRRRGRGGALHEGAAGRVQPRAHRQDRARRADRRRPEQVHRDRGLAAHRRRGRRHPDARPRGRARADRGARGVASPSATRRAVDAALDEARRGRRATRRPTSCRRRSRPPRRARPPASGPARCARSSATTAPRPGVAEAAAGGIGQRRAARRQSASASTEVSEAIGHPIRILVGKPGLDGHSNGAEQIAVRARDVGMEVIYQGIRLTPEQIANSAVEEDVDVVGLSILSGSHRELVPRVVELLRADGADIPVVVGGIIPAGRCGRRCARPASPASTRPRTSRSTGSWARSPTWWPSATAPRSPA